MREGRELGYLRDFSFRYGKLIYVIMIAIILGPTGLPTSFMFVFYCLVYIFRSSVLCVFMFNFQSISFIILLT